MTTKNNTLLRRGIHSELFLLAYVMPDTGYGIAKRHQDTKKRPDTSKTGKALERLEKADYLYLKNKKYYPNIEKLSYDLLEYLDSEGIELDVVESKLIKEILEQNSFFMLLGMDTLYRILTQPTRIHHIDALQVISNHIGMMCTFGLIPEKNNKKTINKTKRKSISNISKELDTDIQIINKKMETSIKGSKSIRKKKMESVNNLGNSIKGLILGSNILDKASTSTLKKLENLWDGHDGFEAGMLTSEKFSNFTK
jgi:hypothetical protein